MEPETKNEAPVSSVVPLICPYCKKDIDRKDLAIDHVKHAERHGRSTTYYYTDEYYHRNCLEIVQHERQEKEEQERRAKIRRKKKISFGWAIFGGVVGLGVGLVIMLALASNGVLHPAAAVGVSIGISYSLFAALYCILSGSYIEDVFLTVASWSIHFPGLIFSWDLEGFMWLIAMKILFVVLGAIASIAVLLLALVLSAVLAFFSFPFVLIHNIRTGYSNQLD